MVAALTGAWAAVASALLIVLGGLPTGESARFAAAIAIATVLTTICVRSTTSRIHSGLLGLSLLTGGVFLFVTISVLTVTT